MTSLHKTNNKTIFTIEGRADLDLSLVFSRDYFNAIGVSGFHISHKYQPIEETQTEAESISNNPEVIVQDLEKDEQQLSERFLGPENIPNGYTQLPVKNTNTTTKQTGGGVIDTLSDFITPFFSSKRVVDEANEGKTLDAMKVSFTTTNVKSFAEWKNEHVAPEPSLYSFQDTTITYAMVERILDDLHAQFCYLRDNGFSLQSISTDFIYVVEDRMVLFDGNAIQHMNTQDVQDKKGCKAVLDVIFDLLGKKQNDVHIDFSNIRNTGVYYTLMRLQNDGVFII